MDTNEPAINVMMKGHMKYMGNRQTVIAQNIANIDTPGYKARELAPLDFKKLVDMQNNHLPMRVTSPTHLSGTLPDTSDFKSDKDRNTFETRPTQNNVVLEDQMGKLSDTGAEFQLSSTMYKKFTTLYRTAAGNK